MQQLSTKLPWDLAQTKWAATLNPLLATPLLSGSLVSATLLASKPQAINHLLSRQPQGWFLVDNTANAVIWRTAWGNTTLTLEATANTTISIWVF
jgi:hypothetical protein